MPPEPKRTSFMRYARVHDILQADNALSRKLSKTMAAVCRPDQTHKEFPVEVVYVTDQIHSQGLDAYTLPKIEIIRAAHRLLVVNSIPASLPLPVSEEAPPSKRKEAPQDAPKPTGAKRGRKPKVKVEPVVEVQKVPDPVPELVEKPKARKKREPKLQVSVPTPAKVVESPVDPEGLDPEKGEDGNLVAFVRANIPNVVPVAAMSNIQAVITLLQPYVDKGDPVSIEICRLANQLLDFIYKNIDLERAKEEPANAG